MCNREEPHRLVEPIDSQLRFSKLARDARTLNGCQTDIDQRSIAPQDRLERFDPICCLPGREIRPEQRHPQARVVRIGRNGCRQQIHANGRLRRALGGRDSRCHEHRSTRDDRRQFGRRAQPVELRPRRALEASPSRRKRPSSLDTDGISLCLRIRNATKTVNSPRGPRTGAGGCDFRTRKRASRGDVPGHGLNASPPEFERLCRVVQTLEQIG